MTDLIRPSGTGVETRDLLEQHARVTAPVRASSTRRAYGAHWRAWTSWAESQGLPVEPTTPGAIAVWIGAMIDEGRPVATIDARVTAVCTLLGDRGQPGMRGSRDVSVALRRARREAPREGRGQAAPLTLKGLRRLVGTCQGDDAGIRDRALILVMWAGAMRRAEIGGLLVRHLVVEDDGLRVTIQRSKTDQEGHGRVVVMPYGRRQATCPVQAWLAWREHARLIADQPAFHGLRGPATTRGMSGHAVAEMLRRRARLAGLDPQAIRGHSPRSGFVSAAIDAGVPEFQVAQQTGHSPGSPVLAGYYRSRRKIKGSAAGKVGL